MSAIFGIINFKNCINDEMGLLFKTHYASLGYRIDHYTAQKTSHAVFYCGYQPTDTYGQNTLPYYDSQSLTLLTADCIIDNKAELSDELGLKQENLSDSEIFISAFKKWDVDLTKHILGAYTAAIWNENKMQLTLLCDHMSNRSLFYFKSEECIYFSTALMPLAQFVKAPINRKWNSACLATLSADMFLFNRLSPFKNIYQLEYATINEFTSTQSESRRFWNLDHIKQQKYRPNADYGSKYIQILEGSVESMLDPALPTGSTLSGGLDSTIISSLAAGYLAKTGKELYSYTSVPLEEYHADPEDKVSITNESPFVAETVKMYPNILPHFLPCQGKNGFSHLRRYIPQIGYPLKSNHNFTWLTEIYSHAYTDGCRLMLKGQFGNSTISYGTALGATYRLLRRGHILRARNVAKGFCSHYRVPKRIFYKCFRKEFRNKFSGTTLPENCLTAQGLLKKYAIPNSMKKNIKNSGGSQMDSKKQWLNYALNPCILMQLSMFDTIMSLIHGIIIRDPSKDVRIIEYIASLPEECLVAGNMERGMARAYTKGLIPDAIRCDIWHRGVQSADIHTRDVTLWNTQKDEVIKALKNPKLLEYVDENMLKELLERLNDKPSDQISETDYRMANVLYSNSIFLNLV